MSYEIDWDTLRRELLKHFDEDTVQQTLLDLVRMEARGIAVLKPLHWCRMRARTHVIQRRIREALGKEVVADLTVLGTHYPGVRRRYKPRKEVA